MELPDNRTKLSGITCPVMLFHSENDKLIDISHARTIRSSLHDCKLVLAKGGHNINLKMYKDELLNFLNI